jgi:DNA-binding transcriptional ArsR family regulator
MSNDIKDFEPEQLYTLSDSEQIRAYVHPARILLLRLLAKERRTISSVARENGVHPANITHHFKALEKAGLVRLVAKIDTGRNLEKYYRAIAYNFIVKPEAQHSTNQCALALSILRDNLSLAIKTAENNESQKILALLGTARLSSKDIDKFIKRLNGLIGEFKKSDSTDGTAYTLNLSLYPNDSGNITTPGAEILL